jgi:hypothetical protein
LTSISRIVWIKIAIVDEPIPQLARHARTNCGDHALAVSGYLQRMTKKDQFAVFGLPATSRNSLMLSRFRCVRSKVIERPGSVTTWFALRKPPPTSEGATFKA